jgi:hypothetical protein
MNGETAGHWLEVVGSEAWNGDPIATSRAVREQAWEALCTTWARSLELMGELRAVWVVSRRLVVETQARRRDDAWREEQQQLRAHMLGANALTRALTARILRKVGLGNRSPCPCRRCRQGRAGRRSEEEWPGAADD